jgi:hypothetical protein
MAVMNRLETLNAYLLEAQQNPLANRLYIEDLKLSIKYQEVIDKNRFSSGFSIDRESEGV